MRLPACIRQASENSRKGGSTRRRQASPARKKLCFNLLEDRLALSGFGPEDGAYIIEPWQGTYDDVQIQPGDQKIVAAAASMSVAAARYDSMGHLDASYGSGGLATLGPNRVQGLVLQPDGKAVVGMLTSSNTLGVGRLTTSGSPDISFGNGGWRSFDIPGRSFENVRGVALQSTGKVVVVGESGSSAVAFAARFTASGAIDSGRTGFGQKSGNNYAGYTLSTLGAPYSSFSELTVQPDNKVVAVGAVNYDGNNSRLVVARYTAEGTLDKTFSGTGYSVLLAGTGGRAVQVQSDGKIVVVGTTSPAASIDRSDLLVARFNTNGTLDTSFGGGDGYATLDVDGTASLTMEDANDVAIQPDGKIVAAGVRASSGIPASVLVARFNPDGTPDAAFGTGGFKLAAAPVGEVVHHWIGHAVALQSDGSIIVAGRDGIGGGVENPLLVRFYGTNVSPAAAEVTSNALALADDDTSSEIVTTTGTSETELIVPTPATNSSPSTSTEDGGANTSTSSSSSATPSGTSDARDTSGTDAFFTSLSDPETDLLADPLLLAF